MPEPQSTILVVDDSPTLLHLVNEYLSQLKLTVQTAANVSEALALARACKPDLILSDIVMPGQDGYALLTEMRTDPELAHIPVVLMTAVDTMKDRMRAVESGAADLLTKPFDKAELQSRVKALLRLKAREDELYLANAQMGERLRLLQTLFVIASQLHDSVDPGDIYRIVRETLIAIVGAQAFSVYLREEDSPLFHLVVQYGDNVAMPETLNDVELPPPLDAVVHKTQAFYHDGPPESAPLLLKETLMASAPILIATPLVTHHTVIGMINVHAFQTEGVHRLDFENLNLLSSQVAGAIHTARRYNQLQHSVQQLEQSSKGLKQTNQTLEQQLFHLNTLTLFSAQLHNSIALPDVYAAIRDLAVNFIGVEVFAIRYYDDWQQVFTSYVGIADKYDIEKRPTETAQHAALVQQVMDSGVNFFREHPDPIFASLTSDETLPLVCLPLTVAFKVRGAFVIESLLPQKKELTKQDYELLALLMDEAGVAIHNGHLHRQLERLSFTDSLTGLYNRRYFDEQMSTEIKRAHRYGHPLSLVLFDIDDFKSVNDRHGHSVGDQVLQEVARRIIPCVRDVDIVARYGGDEFVMILPNTPTAGAVQIAERVRQMNCATPLRHGSDLEIPLTLSLGVSTIPPHENAANLIEAADHALSKAKQDGKNRVVPG